LDIIRQVISGEFMCLKTVRLVCHRRHCWVQQQTLLWSTTTHKAVPTTRTWTKGQL